MKKLFANERAEYKSELLACIVLVPVIVLFALVIVFYIPIDYIKYKRSLYYKKEQKKYSLCDGMGSHFKFYNAILKNNLPIEYFPNPLKPEELESGFFIYKDTLILLNDFYLEFDNEKNEWVSKNEDDTIITLDEYIELDTNCVNTLLGKNLCSKAVVLTKAKKLNNPELAKNDERFLIYNKIPDEVICDFCNS